MTVVSAATLTAAWETRKQTPPLALFVWIINIEVRRNGHAGGARPHCVPFRKAKRCSETHVLRTYRQYRTQGRSMTTRALRRLSSYANLREEAYTVSLETEMYH